MSLAIDMTWQIMAYIFVEIGNKILRCWEDNKNDEGFDLNSVLEKPIKAFDLKNVKLMKAEGKEEEYKLSFDFESNGNPIKMSAIVKFEWDLLWPQSHRKGNPFTRWITKKIGRCYWFDPREINLVEGGYQLLGCTRKRTFGKAMRFSIRMSYKM